MPRMKVVQVSSPNAGLELVERERPDPEPHKVRIKVQACGICHSDMYTVTDARSLSSVVAGLGIDGKLVVVGASGEAM